MAYTYTFPSQETPAGTLEFQVKVLNGSGSSTLTDKYFSSSFKWIEQADLKGGELASPVAEFVIDDDTDNLFQDTIFPALRQYSSFTGDNSVMIIVTLNSNVKFIGVVAPKTINIEYYYASNDELEDKKTSITFSCIWIFDFLKAISASTFATGTLSGASYSKIFVHNTVTYYWSSLYNILRGCCDLLATDFGLTVNLSVDYLGYHFYTNSYLSDANYGLPSVSAARETFYGFNTFRKENARSFDDLELSQGTNTVGILIGANASYVNGVLTIGSFSPMGYMDEEEGNYAGSAYDLFVGILNSFALMARFTYVSATELSVSICSRFSGNERPIPSIIEITDEPFSVLAWRGLNITSKITGNSVNKTFLNSLGQDVFQKELMFDFRNNIELAGYVMNNPVNSIFSLTSMPNVGTLRLIRDLGMGANKLSNSSFDSDLTGWSAVGGTVGTWAYSATTGKNDEAGCLKLSSIVNGSDHSIKQTISPVLESNLVLGSYWVKVVPLTSDADDLEIRLFVDFFIGSARYSGLMHTIKGNELSTDIDTGWKLIASNYDYRYRSTNRLRADGTTRDDNNGSANRRDSEFGRVKPIPYDSFAIRIQPVTFASGCAELYFDECKLYDGYLNTPDIVARMIEDNFVSDNLTALRKVKVDGILLETKISDYCLYEGNRYYIQRLSYDVMNNETELEAINYQQ